MAHASACIHVMAHAKSVVTPPPPHISVVPAVCSPLPPSPPPSPPVHSSVSTILVSLPAFRHGQRQDVDVAADAGRASRHTRESGVRPYVLPSYILHLLVNPSINQLTHVRTVAMGLGHAFHYPFLRGPKPPLTITFNNAIVRTLVSMFTSRQLRASGMPSSKRYRHWMTAHLLAIDIEVVPSSEPGGPDASLLWMGPRWAPEHEGGKPGAKVLFFVHGGGFELPLSAGHMGFLDHVMAQLKEQGLDGDMSVAALEYGLTPDHPYPTQFRQAAEALSHLINRGVPPSSVRLSLPSCPSYPILS